MLGKGKKKGLETEILIPLLIGLVILVIGLAAYFILTGRDVNILKYIENIFRFGG